MSGSAGIKAARGEILDRNGVVLAANQSVCTVSVIHSQIEDGEAVIRVLAKELELPEETRPETGGRRSVPLRGSAPMCRRRRETGSLAMTWRA